MDISLPDGSRQVTPNDVGTLWTMRRVGHRARCALMAWPRGDWELRVVVDGDIVLAERCPRGHEAFVLADEWKEQMVAEGWRQVLPNAGRRRPLERYAVPSILFRAR